MTVDLSEVGSESESVSTQTCSERTTNCGERRKILSVLKFVASVEGRRLPRMGHRLSAEGDFLRTNDCRWWNERNPAWMSKGRNVLRRSEDWGKVVEDIDRKGQGVFNWFRTLVRRPKVLRQWGTIWVYLSVSGGDFSVKKKYFSQETAILFWTVGGNFNGVILWTVSEWVKVWSRNNRLSARSPWWSLNGLWQQLDVIDNRTLACR